MNFLVTGGAGFIGSNLVDFLITKNHKVTVIDNLTSGNIDNLTINKNVILIKKNLSTINVNDFKNFNGIFHLAAQTSVPFSIKNFSLSSKNNLMSSISIFDIAKKYKLPIVYASSSSVYGNLSLGDDEVDNLDILSPYALDKLTLENYARLSYKLYGIPSIGLRFFNVFGPRQNAKSSYSGVISVFIYKLLNNLEITINGGYQTRDFVFVDDVVKIMHLSMIKILNNNIVEIINVGTGKSISIDFLLKKLTKIIQNNSKILRVDLPVGDPEKSNGKFNKLKNLLNIKQKDFSKFEDSLISTINYFKK